jgi:SAM-dependent methyltransferase
MRTDKDFYDESVDYLFRDKLILDPIQWDFRWDMLEFLKNPPVRQGTLLDIGCGTGSFVKRTIDMGFQSYGIEMNERSVEMGLGHFKIDSLYATDLTGLSRRFPDLKFDVVTLFQVLEHLEDPNQIMAEIKQVLKEDAVVVIAVPFRDRWPDTSGEGDCPPHHLTRWSLGAMEYFLNKNGFRITRHLVERFPIQNMSALLYGYILKYTAFLTMRGQGMEGKIDSISKEQALEMLRKRKIKIAIANILGFPIWVLLKLLGARGPHMYLEAKAVGKG